MSSAELDKIEPHVSTWKIMNHGNNPYGQDKLAFFIKEVGVLNLPESELYNKQLQEIKDLRRDSYNCRVLKENIFLSLEIRDTHPKAGFSNTLKFWYYVYIRSDFN